MTDPARIVVMGVSGAGKTTVGEALAARLGVRFVDADHLHPAANVEKMAGGIPLTDDDRWPWLDVVGSAIADESGGIVMACSALKRSYRDAIRRKAPDTVFVLLSADRSTLEYRMSHRDHFMPATLLDSQLETLEPLEPDEPGFAVTADNDVAATTSTIVELLQARV